MNLHSESAEKQLKKDDGQLGKDKYSTFLSQLGVQISKYLVICTCKEILWSENIKVPLNKKLQRVF